MQISKIGRRYARNTTVSPGYRIPEVISPQVRSISHDGIPDGILFSMRFSLYDTENENASHIRYAALNAACIQTEFCFVSFAARIAQIVRNELNVASRDIHTRYLITLMKVSRASIARCYSSCAPRDATIINADLFYLSGECVYTIPNSEKPRAVCIPGTVARRNFSGGESHARGRASFIRGRISPARTSVC